MNRSIATAEGLGGEEREALLVRNVVPTLTSNKRQGLSLNGRCQAIRNTRFILVPAEGRTSSSGVLEALYCSAPGVPVVGLLQARRERKRGLQVPGEVAEDVVGELESKCVVCRVLLSLVILPCVPCGGGVRLPFIGQGEGELHTCRTVQLHGKVCAPSRRVGSRLDGPCRDLAIIAYLVPEQWRLRG
jgi:hypothetical protein